MGKLATGLALTALLGIVALTPAKAAALPTCAELAALIVAEPNVLAATSVITPPAGSTPAYCQFNITQ
jgi:hypothetical protein